MAFTLRADRKLGGVFWRLQRVHHAVLHLEQTVRLDPTWLLLYAELGHAYRACGEFGAARDAYEMALFLDREQPDLWHPLGYCLLRLESWEEAASVLEGHLGLQRGDAQAWAQLGAAYRYLGRTDEAVRALAKGLELGYDEPWVWFESALAAATLDDRGALEKARGVLRERDAELVRRLEDRLRGLAAGTAPSGGCQGTAAIESTPQEEAPSC